MKDRAKIIEAFRRCFVEGDCEGCPYERKELNGECIDIASEALALYEELIAENEELKAKKGKWRRMYLQYQCSCCGAVIDKREDNRLYGGIEFGEREFHCYWCGSLNELERK